MTRSSFSESEQVNVALRYGDDCSNVMMMNLMVPMESKEERVFRRQAAG